MVLGINPEGVHNKKSDHASHANCKQLDYEDYANYLIVMSGDILGKWSVLHILFVSAPFVFQYTVENNDANHIVRLINGVIG